MFSALAMAAELEKRLHNFREYSGRDKHSGFLFANRNGNILARAKIVKYGPWPA